MAEQKPKKVKAKLLVDNHTHEGKPKKKGDIIELPPDLAQWLITGKKAEEVR